MASLAQSMREKKRLKVEEFWRGFEAFPICGNVKFFLEKAKFLKKLKSWKVENYNAERAKKVKHFNSWMVSIAERMLKL